MFSSDNGPWYLGSPGRLRGRKGTTYEGGQRVPFIARFPGRIPKGRTTNAIGSIMDLHPTLAGLCGAPAPKNSCDGIDIWPLLTAARADLDREALLMFDDVHLQCARWKQWKLHVARYNSAVYAAAPAGGRVSLPLPAPELYNLGLDPDESFDVAPEESHRSEGDARPYRDGYARHAGGGPQGLRSHEVHKGAADLHRRLPERPMRAGGRRVAPPGTGVLRRSQETARM
jgi:arylsulfatase A-like enzyme